VFLHWDEDDRSPDAVAARLNAAAEGSPLSLTMISNRGVKVWPDGLPETFCTDHWRCRFKFSDDRTGSAGDVINLLSAVDAAGLAFIKTEHLYRFDGKPAYALGQGE
jgi:isocitrate dehydrogenase